MSDSDQLVQFPGKTRTVQWAAGWNVEGSLSVGIGVKGDEAGGSWAGVLLSVDRKASVKLAYLSADGKQSLSFTLTVLFWWSEWIPDVERISQVINKWISYNFHNRLFYSVNPSEDSGFNLNISGVSVSVSTVTYYDYWQFAFSVCSNQALPVHR